MGSKRTVQVLILLNEKTGMRASVGRKEPGTSISIYNPLIQTRDNSGTYACIFLIELLRGGIFRLGIF
jgi:hypothetical protein